MARRNLSPEQKRELQRMQRKIAFQLKAEKRWTQEQVAADLKVSQQAISKIVAKEKKRREVFEERKAGVSQEVQFADRTVKNPASILPAGPTQQRPSVGSHYSPAALTAARQSPSAAPMSM